jgi:predicted transposase YbfD/YdcC
MHITPARAARLVKRADLNFQSVADPRKENITHSLDGILRGIVIAFSCCFIGLRDIEDLLDSLAPRLLNKLGLKNGSVSDTAIWELLVRLNHEQLRTVVTEQIKSDLNAKHITNNLFPKGVLTIDGKGAGSGMGETSNSKIRQSTCDAKGTKFWNAFALRACLTSSTVRPILDQEFIETKEWEPTAFPVLFERVVEQFPKLFEWVTYDAGLTSYKSAKLVIGHNKKYLAALKANFGKLFPQAEQLLTNVPIVASTKEQAGGKQVIRELRQVAFPSDYDFPGATELWGVRQIRIDAAGKTETENRIFIVPKHDLDGDKCLQLVRLHWGIENGANWTADMILREDTRTPCASGNGVLVIAWLRILAFNLLSAFRAHLPLKDRRPEQWMHAANAIRQALVICGIMLSTQKELAAMKAELLSAIA